MAIVVVAVSAMASALLWGSTPNGYEQLLVIAASGQAIIVGIMLVLYQQLMRRNMAADETFNLGFDRGYEEGHEVGRTEGRTSHAVVDIRRCTCRAGKTNALTSIGSVGDRG